MMVPKKKLFNVPDRCIYTIFSYKLKILFTRLIRGNKKGKAFLHVFTFRDFCSEVTETLFPIGILHSFIVLMLSNITSFLVIGERVNIIMYRCVTG